MCSKTGKPLFRRWINVFFLVVVAGFLVQYTHQQPSIIFALNLVAVLTSYTHIGAALKSLGIQYTGFAQALLYMTFGYDSHHRCCLPKPNVSDCSI